MEPNGDEFEQVMQGLLGPVRAFCGRMLGDEHAGEDAAQKTFFKAFQAWSRFKANSTRKTWVFRIAANVCARHLERARIRQTQSVDEAGTKAECGTHPGAGLESLEQSAQVHSALQAMTPAHRMVLVLFCIEELGHGEIAHLLGCPEGTIWSRLHHARKQFASKLRECGFDPEVEVN